MKKIRIKICGLDESNVFSFGYFLLKVLRKHYEVELSETPDYVFCEESNYDYLNYDCTRIYFTGENVTPNFNVFDYAIGFDYMNFGDRYFRLPLYLITSFYSTIEVETAGDIDFEHPVPFTKQDLSEKTDFCSFVYSNYMARGARGDFFELLSKYKTINSGGGYLNNVGGKVPNKLAFETKHKFSIAFENSSRSGYTTEKIVGALAAKTIPIYWGNPDIHKEFNQERFINCHAFENFEQVVERIKEIDADDELYLSIINKQVTVDEYNFKKVRADFEDFLHNIFAQPRSAVKRRGINPVRAKNIEAGIRMTQKHIERKNKIQNIVIKVYKPFKKVKFIEKLKYKLFQSK